MLGGQNSILPWNAIMRGELSPPRPTPSSPVGGEMVLVSAPKPVWVAGSPGVPAWLVGSAKLAWLKTLKNWVSKRKVTCSVIGNLLGYVELGVGEVRAAEVVAAGVAELAVGGRVAAGTRAGAGIDDGFKRIRVEPLQAAGLGDAGDGCLAVERDAGNAVGDTVARCPGRCRGCWRCRAR